jgi:acylphosphatase/BMFP domain-containing protein YqiC
MSDQVRAVMRVFGGVQRVGYRFAVQDLARRMGVKGHVKNLPDGSVEIVAEASKETIDEFVGAVKITEPPIDVVRVDVVYSDATGEYEYFNLVREDVAEELVEGFGSGLKHINLSRAETKQGFQKLEESIKSTHEDLKGSIEGMHKDLKTSIQDMHGDINKHFEEMAKRYDAISSELIRTREELTRAVDNMSRLIDELIRRRRKHKG